jgi:hypothetical protein
MAPTGRGKSEFPDRKDDGVWLQKHRGREIFVYESIEWWASFTIVKRVAARWAKSVSVTKNTGLEMTDDVPDAVAFISVSWESDPSLDTSIFRPFEFPPFKSSSPPGLSIMRNRFEKISLTFELPCLCIRQLL